MPPVTAERSPPDSRMTGADSPVIADSSTEAIPSITSPSAGMRWPAVTTTTSPAVSSMLGTLDGLPVGQPPPGEGLRARAPERRGLRLAASLGHRLREVREQHGEPEPCRDQGGEEVLLRARVRDVLQKEDGHDHAPDLDEEHHGVARDVSWVELAERGEQGATDDPGVEQGGWLLRAHSCRCSRIGPSASIGM